MTMTLLASNELGALIGNHNGEVTFFDSHFLAINQPHLTMPKATGEGLGIIIPDLINFGPAQSIDYRQYNEGNKLSVKAAFDGERQLWFVPELPKMPPILRLA